MSLTSWIDKKNVAHIQNRILLNWKEKHDENFRDINETR